MTASHRIAVVFAALLYCSCSPHRQFDQAYLYEFKMTYFDRLLKAGFNNDPGYLKAVKMDRSHYGEIILTLEDYRLIDSLVTIDNRTMSSDSLESIDRVAEGSAGKRVYGFALRRYQSKWLEDLAKDRCKRVPNKW